MNRNVRIFTARRRRGANENPKFERRGTQWPSSSLPPTGGGTWYFEATATDATGVTVVDGFLRIQIAPAGLVGNPVPFLNQPLVPTAD